MNKVCGDGTNFHCGYSETGHQELFIHSNIYKSVSYGILYTARETSVSVETIESSFLNIRFTFKVFVALSNKFLSFFLIFQDLTRLILPMKTSPSLRAPWSLTPHLAVMPAG